MQDHELYRRIRGIEEPWRVASVDLKLDAGVVHVHLAHEEGIDWSRAECGASSKLHDHPPERRWRHLDTCQYRTILHASPPRSECREHGVRVVKLPWAEPSSRFTALLVALAIAWLKAASRKAVVGPLQLSWDEIHGIMERVVKRGLQRAKLSRWRWTRGTPTLPRCGNMCQKRVERSRTTSFTSPSISTRRWIRCATRRGRSCERPGMTG